MGGENECTIPKTKAVASDKTHIEELRLHHQGDEVHVHDDKANLRFCYKGKRAFQLGTDAFIRRQHEYQVGTILVVVGADSAAKGRHAADLVYTRQEDGWTMKLVERGTVKGKEVICDPVISKLDDFIQRL